MTEKTEYPSPDPCKDLSFLAKIGIIALFIILLLIAWQVFDVLLLTFGGVLLAIFLRSLSYPLIKKGHLSNTVSISIILIILMGLFFLILAVLVPTVNEQFGQLMEELPTAWAKIENQIQENFNLRLPPLDTLFSPDKQIISHAANFFSTTFGILGSFFFFLTIGIFLAYDPQPYLNGIIKLTPPSKREDIQDVINQSTSVLRWWLLGTIFAMSIIGISTAVGLWLLDVPLALTLGLIAALLNFIPNIGPILSAVPAILVALIQSPIKAFYVVILYFFTQIIESYILTPAIQQRAIELPSVLIIVVQLMMALLTGIVGLALATPLLAVFVIMIKKFYIEEILHDKC